MSAAGCRSGSLGDRPPVLSHKVLTRADVGAVGAYYADGADDYFAKEGESQVWQGRGAEMLGLSGQVQAGRFQDLLAGRVTPGQAPARGSTRADSKSRIGIDFTFSAPKSVSILALVGGHSVLVEAHDRAVTKVMELVEQQARARQKSAGATHEERTGNLIIAKFRHETTREQDPALHTHAVIMNLTRRADGQWRALRNEAIIKMTGYLGVLYRAELSRELQDKGYELRFGREGTFEIASVSRTQIEGFSRRSGQVEAELAKSGLTRATATTAQRQMATMKTRQRKSPEMDREALHATWRRRTSELGIELGDRARTARQKSSIMALFKPPAAIAASRHATAAVRYAIGHLSEREAAFTGARLMEVAMQHGVEGSTLEAVLAAVRREVDQGRLVQEEPCYAPAKERSATGRTFSQLVGDLRTAGEPANQAHERVYQAIADGRLVKLPPRFTTPSAIENEREILRIEREGRRAIRPFHNPERAAHRLPHNELTTEQWKAAVLMLSTSHRVVGIEGLAGTGKSHMLQAAKKEIEKAGHEVRVLAPYGAQVKALRELGVKANTVSSFLAAKSRELSAATVLVVDEAGVVPTRQMAAILKLAETADARVVLIGDRQQTKAIEAGRPFDQLIKAGMDLSRMTEIQRQLDPKLKEAVGLAASGKAAMALERIKDVYEIGNPQARREAIADAYARLSPAEQQRTLIISGTNEARREINANVRRALRLDEGGVPVEFLVRRDTTREERKFAKNYEVGDRVQPERDYPAQGLKKGVAYRVTDIGKEDRLTVADASGRKIVFRLGEAQELSVYSATKAQLTKGDLVRITRNDAARDLANGDCLRVEAITSQSIYLSDGKHDALLPRKDPLHLDYGYARTVHGSQGLTVDRVIYEAEAGSPTTAQDTFYVGLSRARLEVQLFTDDSKRLPGALQRERNKTAALDLQRERDLERTQRGIGGRELG